MKKIFTLIVVCLTTVSTWAGSVEIDGINYNLITNSNEAEVTNGKNYARNVVIPSTIEYHGVTYSVTSIGQGAFFTCKELSSVTIPNSVKSIGDSAFRGCPGLTSMIIPNSVKSIGNWAFTDSSNLNSVTIGDSVTSLGENTFQGCTGLISVSIGKSLTSVGKSAFRNCSNLTSVRIPSSVTSVEEAAFWGCSKLSTVTIANSVTSLGKWAFYSCSSLTSVTIPNSVTSISDYAFLDCSGLSYVTIGASVKSIGQSAFFNCEKLDTVVCYASSIPSASGNAFGYTYVEGATLIVPESAMQTYLSTEPWNKFGTFKSIESSGPLEKCVTPTITFTNGKLSFSSETTDADICYTIAPYSTNSGIVIHDSNKAVRIRQQQLIVSCYALKIGYKNSDTITKIITIAPGDVNCDGKIDITDVTHLVDQILER